MLLARSGGDVCFCIVPFAFGLILLNSRCVPCVSLLGSGFWVAAEIGFPFLISVLDCFCLPLPSCFPS